MENPWYSELRGFLEETGPLGRPVKRIGDKGPGPDEPGTPRWWKTVLDFMSRRGFATSQDFVFRPRFPLADLPPMDFEPMAFQPPPPPLKRTEREKLLKAMEKSIAKEFRKRLSRGEAPAAGMDIKKLFSPSPLPTLRFERQAPLRPVATPRAKGEVFTDMPSSFVREPWPRQRFSDAERVYDSPTDFRPEGEKRRDARQAAARREPYINVALVPEILPSLINMQDTPDRTTHGGSRGRAVHHMVQLLDKKEWFLRRIYELMPSFEKLFGRRARAADAFIATMEMTVGLSMMSAGVAIGIATILDDFLTGGLGVADDPLTFSLAFKLFERGAWLFAVAQANWQIIISNEEDFESPKPTPDDLVAGPSPSDAVP